MYVEVESIRMKIDGGVEEIPVDFVPQYFASSGTINFSVYIPVSGDENE